jgi:hypothetical protein
VKTPAVRGCGNFETENGLRPTKKAAPLERDGQKTEHDEMDFTTRSRWRRVSRNNRCLICGRPDWCLFTGDADNPDAAICSRIESPKRVGTKGAGWLHVLRENPFRPERRQVRSIAPPEPMIDFGAMAGECYSALGDDRRGELASALGVSRFSLERLGVGWSEQHRSFTFPMRSADFGDINFGIIGIRLRRPDGSKWAVKGSKHGLFLPYVDTSDQLLICEGPTDTAAMLDLSFEAVGRPSCTGGVAALTSIATGNAGARLAPKEIAIIADDDGPGHRGAWQLASVLVSYLRSVRVVTPPEGIKDAREWKRQGATRLDILDAIAAAPALQIIYSPCEVAR